MNLKSIIIATLVFVSAAELMLFSGCTMSPPVLTQDQLKKMSFDEYFKNQKYGYNHDSEGNYYYRKYDFNIKDNIVVGNFTDVSNFCVAQGGETLSMGEFQNKVNPFIKDSATDPELQRYVNEIAYSGLSGHLCRLRSDS